jgi:hypothetical protein
MTSFTSPLVIPPKIEDLTIAYLTPYMGGVPLVTKLPKPPLLAGTIGGTLRVEAGGGSLANYTQWDMTVLLHAYHPDETAANDIANQAVSLMAVARGQTVNGFYIVTVEHAAAPYRHPDPDVILPRYFATATWRVAGMPWTPPPPP